MSRIQTTFTNLANNKRKALIPFITAGDPHPDMTVNLLHALVDSGADMIELGIPFSDPMADGPVIQRASERALANNVGINKTIDLVKDFRKDNEHTPIILMGYANPIEAIGLTNFVGAIKEAGVDGVITVDYPPEESKEFVSLLLKNDIDSIFLLSPTTEDERIKLIISQATGFIYYVSLKGVTGSANIDMEQVSERVNNVRQFTNLPVAVGFGVKDAKTAKEVAAIADAVVIGSRIVLEIEQSNKDDLIGNIKKLMREMKDAIE
ncbi:MAG: tryptophan synthase subunit alpha [Methylophilales bacterium BACL14 MAG-120910-bin43]|jgi:tryptophan synthase alpha chain|nr:MAG: tryptophan synthase subunit alpha [Methylophilales bacterium BACL14 MAG-120910-bin43]KRP07893.1 MAG: tryptophan synthase subunit alpha [Methylophilales bacterium BACL14 MAG-120920-bin58]